MVLASSVISLAFLPRAPPHPSTPSFVCKPFAEASSEKAILRRILLFVPTRNFLRLCLSTPLIDIFRTTSQN